MTGIKIPGKILCLHGFAQDAETFRAKSSGLRKSLKKIGLETYYLNAPVTFLPADLPFDLELSKLGTDANKKEYRGWWRKNEQEYNIDEAVATIRECCEKEGPFIGIMGFSQGAGLAGMLASNFEKFILQHSPLKFGIFFSGFKITDNRQLDQYYEKKINIPTLHIIGELDTVVSSERTMRLYDECCMPGTATLYKHPGGHFVPNAKNFVEKIIAWIVNNVDEGKKKELADAAAASAAAATTTTSNTTTVKGKKGEEEEELDDILAMIDNLGKR